MGMYNPLWLSYLLTSDSSDVKPYMGNVHGGSFCGFSLTHECFPANNALVDQQYKSTEMLQ